METNHFTPGDGDLDLIWVHDCPCPGELEPWHDGDNDIMSCPECGVAGRQVTEQEWQDRDLERQLDAAHARAEAQAERWMDRI